MVSNQYEDTKVYCSGSAYNECGSDYVFALLIFWHFEELVCDSPPKYKKELQFSTGWEILFCLAVQKAHVIISDPYIKLTRQTFKDIVLNNFNNHLRCLVIFYVKKICVNLLPLLVKMNQLIISREPSVWQLFFTYILGKIGRYR